MIRGRFFQLISLIFVCSGLIEADVGSTPNEYPDHGCDSELIGTLIGDIQLLHGKISELLVMKSEIQLMSDKINELHFIKSEIQLRRDEIRREQRPMFRGRVLEHRYSPIEEVEEEEVEEDKEEEKEEEKGLCQPGFTYVREAGNCYKVVYEKFNWTSAGKRCQELNPRGHLVTLTTQKENDAVMKFLRRDLRANSNNDICKSRPAWGGNNKLWTSLQRVDMNCQSPFVWKMPNGDRLPLNHTDWYPKEPNCYENKEHCAHLLPIWKFRWNDISCDIQLCAVCEYDRVEVQQPLG